MTITFLSNYINHHQIPFSNACYELLGNHYSFVQTQPMEQERVAMGWNQKGQELPYVHCLYEEEELCRRLILESDVLLAGWTGREDLLEERLRAGKLTIRISERLYREGQWKAVSPRGLLAKYREHTRYRNKPVYLLCAGAYVPSDFHIVRAYPGKMLKWGYFPKTRRYEDGAPEKLKTNDGKVHIVWAGRFIPLKHPEYVLRLADSLLHKNEKGKKLPDFHIHFIGSGVMEEELQRRAKELGVTDHITFYGFQTPEQVRNLMEKCHIHLFTSNYLEGWGAVLNEAMNSGCTVVANAQAGAVPYLIEQGRNGMAYPDDSYEEMEKVMLYLLQHPAERAEMGQAAYRTITEQWNAEQAAERLITFLEGLQQGELKTWPEGPLSPAPVVAPRKMFQQMLQAARRTD